MDFLQPTDRLLEVRFSLYANFHSESDGFGRFAMGNEGSFRLRDNEGKDLGIGFLLNQLILYVLEVFAHVGGKRDATHRTGEEADNPKWIAHVVPSRDAERLNEEEEEIGFCNQFTCPHSTLK